MSVEQTFKIRVLDTEADWLMSECNSFYLYDAISTKPFTIRYRVHLGFVAISVVALITAITEQEQLFLVPLFTEKAALKRQYHTVKTKTHYRNLCLMMKRHERLRLQERT